MAREEKTASPEGTELGRTPAAEALGFLAMPNPTGAARALLPLSMGERVVPRVVSAAVVAEKHPAEEAEDIAAEEVRVAVPNGAPAAAAVPTTPAPTRTTPPA